MTQSRAKTPLPQRPISLEQLQAYGVTDPQIRIYQDKAYLYASHDIDPASKSFVMPDWQLWSSPDLVSWSYETTLDPRETYIGKAFDGCWAGDCICRNGVYYWCFSAVDQSLGSYEIGLVSAPTPEGPWTDPIGAAWIKSDAADTHVYDPGFLQLENGETYLVFGVWDYYIARLKEDMSGLAEEPRKIEIANPAGPYGKGKTDDKPFLHQRSDLFYLSWGSFYATSRNVYGPYEYRGCIIDPQRMESSFREKTWPHGPQQGRHGSFFDWKGQSFFIYCDMSFSGNRYFRGSWISYVHYREDGSIAPIEVTADAVCRYSAKKTISAANFSSGTCIAKVETGDGVFSIAPKAIGASLHYPNIRGLKTDTVAVELSYSSPSAGVVIQLHSLDSQELSEVALKSGADRQKTSFTLSDFDPAAGLTLRFGQAAPDDFLLHSLRVSNQDCQ